VKELAMPAHFRLLTLSIVRAGCLVACLDGSERAQAGSIVGFLIRRRGLDDIRDRWTRETPHGAHPLGADGARLEREWLDSLAGVRPATLDILRVIKEGC
jgi:hypothetical protein